jgi:hypothetical protein
MQLRNNASEAAGEMDAPMGMNDCIKSKAVLEAGCEVGNVNIAVILGDALAPDQQGYKARASESMHFMRHVINKYTTRSCFKLAHEAMSGI